MIVFAFLLFTVIAPAQNDTEDTVATPVVTQVGKPDGVKSEIKLNKDGGLLKSSDAKIDLLVPAGAVSKKTNFSIQPVTNLMTNGNGKAYRLEPSGTKFQKPVKIIFHYDGEEIKDSMQLLMGIAMQDNKGQWLGLNKFELDTVTKTISGYINHFSDWSNFSAIKIDPGYARVKVTNTRPLTVTGVVPTPTDESNDEIVPLYKSPRKVIWKVNEVVGGNATVGTIGGRMLGAYYTAPAKVPGQNPVAATASLQGLNLKFNGINFKDLRLISNLLIYDNAYEVTMITSLKGSAGSVLGTCTYKDTGSFVVSLNGKEARVIEKVNKNLPDKLDYTGQCILKQLKPGSGNIHISGRQAIKVTPASAPGKSAMIEITFSRFPVVFPLIQFTCPDRKGGMFTSTNAQANAIAAGMMSAFPQQIKFEAKEEEQTILQFGEEGSEIFTKFTVKQIKEE